MRKIIWTCWFQGLEEAPDLVRACVSSWRQRNPGWDLRCLDAGTIGKYVDLAEYVDLSRQRITAASLSDILRILLLHEYGGVWVDATTFCNTPLDEWISPAIQTGFFAFARPGEDRELASWFIAARPGNRLLAAWAARALAYWRDRASTQDYFWLHHQFGELIASDSQAFADWHATPRIGADGPHSVQQAGFSSEFSSVQDEVDWSAPVFKLTYRYNQTELSENSLIVRLLALHSNHPATETSDELPTEAVPAPLPIYCLKVGTENLGDHIQIIAGARILARAGLAPSKWVDRDDEIADVPTAGPGGILLNGWFKTNPEQWPPHVGYVPIYLGFHIRLFQSPSLIAPQAIANYKTHGPVGCRDRYTLSLLQSHGVEAFLSHCMSITYPRRLPDPEAQREVFVVSRDQRLCDYIPDDLGPYTFINHYSGDRDFWANMVRSRALLDTYRTRARLIVTTLLHCALPAIAMGIPVIVFYPLNDGATHDSDSQRFSSLADIVRIYDLTEARLIDWCGASPDVGGLKLALMDHFFSMAKRWGTLQTPRIEGIAPSTELPVPDCNTTYSYFNDPERLERLARAKAPDRQKWGAASSYNPQWAERAQLAANFVADGERVLEVGVGGGAFRDLIVGRCPWVGTDLQPVLPAVQSLNVESDELPAGPWDVVVMLGVLEYIHDTSGVLAKLFGAGSKLVMTYCLPRNGDVAQVRRSRGWVNDLTLKYLEAQAEIAGFVLAQTAPFNSADDFDQKVLVFTRKI
ncbi:capsular polysaccharide synthesis protein [Brevundimonas sp. SL130]|uniref:capsular polysaccharide synthesis protein n=1 Tax=Brevundimonas sp. SL130 TaxID=2995143 RepID=UPI00226CD4C2|nr:capsular polysaccharide synthesis protein [Brevundimonas sp. SL130]WAC60331.1 polysaccharide pyruvyl transferase family protein [Brevundimonas sp. SL130]